MQVENRNKIRCLIREIRVLVAKDCHIEARLKLAIAFDQWTTAKALMHLGELQRLDKGTSRGIQSHQMHLTNRLLEYVGKNHGHEIQLKLTNALINNQDMPI
jgi:hypothetical protein